MGSRTDTYIKPPAERSAGGFSLIELIVVIVIIGIVSGVAISSTTQTGQIRQRAAARMILKDLIQCRDRALATGSTQWARIDAINERIEYYQGPTVAGWTAIIEPSTGAQLRSELDGNGAWVSGGVLQDIKIATVNGSTATVDIGFDWLGRPLNNAGTPLTTVTTLTVGATNYANITISITALTGNVSAVFP